MELDDVLITRVLERLPKADAEALALLLGRMRRAEADAKAQRAALTESRGYGSPASTLAHCAREHLREMGKPEHQPVYGPTAGFLIALARGADIMDALTNDHA